MTWFLLSLPAVTAVLWAGVVGVLSWRRPASFGRMLLVYGGHVQLAVLVLVAAVVVLADGGVVDEPAAVRDVRVSGGFVVVVLLVAAATGPLLYVGELLLAVAVDAVVPAGRWRALVEGGTAEVAATTAGGRSAWVPLVVALPAVEELLWRRLLVPHLVTGWGWTPVVATIAAAASFGMNHYWFGLRNVVTKTLLGVVWGTLYLLGGLGCALVAHLSFQIFAWRGLTRPRVRMPEPDRLAGVTS
ncbi:MAG TPA: CPBP family glutamic-type intramembrane protease [Frankiaceae bacterium]|nr:CPBP family glutamic-type intramembrane protease [Frankiaceae bacterium]